MVALFNSSSAQGESDRENFERIVEAIRSSKKVGQTVDDASCSLGSRF